MVKQWLYVGVLMSNIFGDISDFFSGLIGGTTSDIAQGVTGLPSAVQSWFASVGGQIASGLEAAGIAALKDVFDVIIGPLEIIVGAVLILFALTFAFKDDLFQAAKMFGMVSM
jgi:hypothetical protein